MNKRTYRIDQWDSQCGFITFDYKKNEDSACIAAEVTAKSRNQWFRVVHAGKVIAEYDHRPECCSYAPTFRKGAQCEKEGRCDG